MFRKAGISESESEGRGVEVVGSGLRGEKRPLKGYLLVLNDSQVSRLLSLPASCSSLSLHLHAHKSREGATGLKRHLKPSGGLWGKGWGWGLQG